VNKEENASGRLAQLAIRGLTERGKVGAFEQRFRTASSSRQSDPTLGPVFLPAELRVPCSLQVMRVVTELHFPILEDIFRGQHDANRRSWFEMKLGCLC